jgi:hypothetical protein
MYRDQVQRVRGFNHASTYCCRRDMKDESDDQVGDLSMATIDTSRCSFCEMGIS